MCVTEQEAGAFQFHFLKAMDLSNKMAQCHDEGAIRNTESFTF